MEETKIDIKKGIKFHKIVSNKFKTDLIAVFITVPLQRDTITYNALLPMVLRRGTNNIKTQQDINKELENMYGASFDCGVDKNGDNQVMKFYLEILDNQYVLENEDILKQGLKLLIDIVCNPYIENNAFLKKYVDGEKQNLKQLIEEKIDDKAKYALERCTEEMYKNKPYGMYKYGYIEDLNDIDENKLYNYYKKMLQECKIDIFITGDIKSNIEDEIRNNENIMKLAEREEKYIKEGERDIEQENNIVNESMNISQGKLVIGLDLQNMEKEKTYSAMVYNAILGGGSNSKLFQNVREKASLAYTASSSYVRYKSNIFIRCGIEIKNYKKAIEIIKKQLEDMKNGIFTDEDIENAKKGIISSIKSIDDEQDTEITYFFGQELTNNKITLEEYIKKIQNISKENIIKIANDAQINTIYFLKNKEL